jgi:asparagine synthase (glutamine-hydrolysing)
MCGITGHIFFKEGQAERDTVQRMTDAVGHRGPDADGFFVEGQAALGHRRLSIIDLSAAANQPFTDRSGRYVMVYNGEIYNFRQVKEQLTEYPFLTNGDTEMLIAAYAAWGPGCLSRTRGMFAFAIWDREKKEIFLCRDRLGVKPLYYYYDGRQLLFSSEVRSILASGLVKRKLNRSALIDYFNYQSVSSPTTIIEGVDQLEAGTWIRIGRSGIEKKLYWDITQTKTDFEFSDLGRTRSRIRELMLQSVQRRLVSDVPVGAFLSGGIDSSAIVGLMAEAGPARPNTFNISFNEQEYDESSYAKIVARKFNTNHVSILLKPTVLLDELTHALDSIDSPSGDGINTYVVSKAIREKGITVALSGVGGDELFAGYPIFNQYLELAKMQWFWSLPASFRKGISKLMHLGIHSGKWDRVRQLLSSEGFSIEQSYSVFRQILSPELINLLLDKRSPVKHATLVEQELIRRKENLRRMPLLSQMSAAEFLGYTQQTLLKDTDQMSMASSLEVREPYFDQDLVEFVLAVPDRFKKPTYPKSLLVESLKPLLPDEVVFRKKKGFLFPWNLWMKNELRSFCEEQISIVSSLKIVDPAALENHWRRFLTSDTSVRWTELWIFVVLGYWIRKNEIECD